MFRRSARQPPTQLPTPARKTRTRIRWLVAVAAAVTSGLAAGAIPAQAENASLAGYSATISATSPHALGAVHGKVDGYALVYYEVPRRPGPAGPPRLRRREDQEHPQLLLRGLASTSWSSHGSGTDLYLGSGSRSREG
jgi:hypothetical protein